MSFVLTKITTPKHWQIDCHRKGSIFTAHLKSCPHFWRERKKWRFQTL
ncbi:hypothetical protein DWW15_13560 [Subdoligranulum sp. AF14-43]|nr:hypothetical protein DWW15_13560 [Subdoligranulum sp. AF14-43]